MSNNFWISAFRLPRACIDEIKRLCSAFLWSGPTLNSKKAKIAWPAICKPKEEGGLGIKSIKTVNDVCCFRLIWRIVSGNRSLWVNWIRQHLIRKGSFWSVKATTGLGSWMWRKLLKFRSQAKSFIRVEINSGNNSSFWFDDWSLLGCLHERLGDRGFIDLGLSPSTTVSEALSSHSFRHHRLAFLNQIEIALNKLRSCPPNSAPDAFLWKRLGGKFNSVFSSHKTWQLIRETSPAIVEFRGIWFQHATPKFSFIVWLAFHNRLSTGDRMRLWNSVANLNCVFCNGQLETRDHLFFNCRVTGEIWRTLSRGLLRRQYSSGFSTILSILTSSAFLGSHLLLLRYTFQATIYTIWMERNRRKQRDTHRTSALLIKVIDRIVRNRLSTIRELTLSKHQDILQLWFSNCF